MKSSEVSIKTRSTPASLTIQAQVIKDTTVKWSVVREVYNATGAILMMVNMMHLSMVCPRGGGGGGGQMSISPTLDLHYKSDSHPWGPHTLHSNFKELIGTHNTLFQHDQHLHRVITWGCDKMVPTICAFPQVKKSYSI